MDLESAGSPLKFEVSKMLMRVDLPHSTPEFVDLSVSLEDLKGI